VLKVDRKHEELKMPTDREIIYIKTSRSFDLLRKAVQGFRDYLGDSIPPGASEYYQARNFLKEGAALFDEALKEAKKLMGPIPLYAPKEFESRRQQILDENKLIVHGEGVDEVEAQLGTDEFIRGIMSESDINSYVRDRFETQRTGKRKLANFKARLILDKLNVLVSEGRRLQQEAQKKRQGITV
jgi:hypothetical protein